MPNIERRYRPAEFAKEFQISKRTVYRMIATGQLRSVRVNNMHRIPQEEWCKYCRGTGQCRPCRRKG